MVSEVPSFCRSHGPIFGASMSLPHPPSCGFPGIPGPAGRITGPGSSTGGCRGTGVLPVGNGKPCTCGPGMGRVYSENCRIWAELTGRKAMDQDQTLGIWLVKTQGIRIKKKDLSRFKQDFCWLSHKTWRIYLPKTAVRSATMFWNSTSINMGS